MQFMTATTVADIVMRFPVLADNAALQEMDLLVQQLAALGYAEYFQFKPALMRGFDYYDGMVFEVFDKHPDNNRAMFGG
jgi:histidyl-tRNA synthetase